MLKYLKCRESSGSIISRFEFQMTFNSLDNNINKVYCSIASEMYHYTWRLLFWLIFQHFEFNLKNVSKFILDIWTLILSFQLYHQFAQNYFHLKIWLQSASVVSDPEPVRVITLTSLKPKRTDAVMDNCDVIWSLLTCDAAVGGHHHLMVSWVFNNVLPVDCVSMAQELVLVNIHASTQDLCGRREEVHSQYRQTHGVIEKVDSWLPDENIVKVTVRRKLGQSRVILLLLRPLIFSVFIVLLVLLFPRRDQTESIIHHNTKSIWELSPGAGQQT